ncbi:hypothetical protein [Sphingomonas sp.]|uniref:hypothetical protein n=1 Tax=Sphingomonas sp. TaxID=28214 RepID=UPI0017F3496C|nr:hypothetical protein [Sphingomonas sp.]MBA4761824.1 hypothetical protein [Sphingomonas sp.]
MKTVVTLIAALAISPAVLVAAAPAAKAQGQASFSIDSPIETLMATPKARAVLDRELPGLDKHPMYDTFKSMSLVRLQPLSSGQISEEKLATIKAALTKASTQK